jgi:hypothetical protein
MEENERAEKYLQAAADCIELARQSHDQERRASLLALAQKWLDIAGHRSPLQRFQTALEEFNKQQLVGRNGLRQKLNRGAQPRHR